MSHSPRFAATRSPRRRNGTTRDRHPSRRSLRSTLALVGALLVATIALTGCVTVQLTATVHSDGTVSGTSRVGVSKALASLGGGTQSILDQLRSTDSCDFGGKQGTTSTFDDGTYVGIDCRFSGVTMAQFNSGNDAPTLSRSGGHFQLAGHLNLLDAISASSGGALGLGGGAIPAPSALPSGLPTDLASLLPSDLPSNLASLLPSDLPSNLASLLPSDLPSNLASLLPSDLPSNLASLLPSDLPSGGNAGLDPSAVLKTAKISFAFTFPGKVLSSHGRVAGRTVTFAPDANGDIDFTTTAEANGASGPGALGTTGWLILALVIAAAIVAATWWARRRRAPRTATLPGSGEPLSGYDWRPPAQQATPYGPPPNYPAPDRPTTNFPAAGDPTANYPANDQGHPRYPTESQYSPFPPAGSDPDQDRTRPYEPPPPYAPRWDQPDGAAGDSGRADPPDGAGRPG